MTDTGAFAALTCSKCGKEIEGTEPVYCHTVYQLFDWQDRWWRGEENETHKEQWYCQKCEEENEK